MARGFASRSPAANAPLQRKAGAAPRLVAQRKLDVGPANDRFEQEAERVSERVMRQLNPAGPAPGISPLVVQRKAKKPEEKPAQLKAKKPEDKPAQRKAKKPEEKTTQRKAKKPEEKPAQRKAKKPEEKPAQRKAKKPEERPVQRMPALVQRDADLEPDTDEESTVQAKRGGKPAATKMHNTPEENVQKAGAPRPTRSPEKPSREDELLRELSGPTRAQTARVQRKCPKSPKRSVGAPKKPAKSKPPCEPEDVTAAAPAPAQTQRDSAGADGGAFAVPASTEATIAGMRGRGAPLDSNMRDYMEPRFGRDFSNVRVHAGSGAGAAASDLGARAFTVGNDIFFGAGAYNSGSDAGRRLIAHELTHTVQQGGGSAKARPMRVQRANGKGKKPGKKTEPATQEEDLTPGKFVDPKLGTIDTTTTPKTLTLPELLVPKIGGRLKGKEMRGKAKGSPGLPDSNFVFSGRVERGETARQQWIKGVDRSALEQKVKGLPAPGVKKKGEKKGDPVLYLRSRSTKEAASAFLIIGTAKQIASNENVLIPTWTREGTPELYDVDHIHELQLGGIDGMANFWLLTQNANRSAGNKIADNFKKSVTALLEGAEQRKDADGNKNSFWAPKGDGGKRPDTADLRRPPKDTWTVTFKGIKADKFDARTANWTKEEIETGEQLAPLKPMTEKEIAAEGLLQDEDGPEVVSIFTSPTGGFRRLIKVDEDPPKLKDTKLFKGEGDVKGDQFYKGFVVESISYNFPANAQNELGEVVGTAFPSKSAKKKTAKAGTGKPQPKTGVKLPILWDPNLGFSGYVGVKYLNERMGRLLDLDGLSPVTVNEAGITGDGQIFARGYLRPTKALFGGDLQIPIEVLGDKVTLRFPIPTDKLNFGPVSVTDAALDVGIDDDGVFFGGYANVAVNQVGTGRVEGHAGGIIKGTFNFDFDFLDKTTAGFTYDIATDTLTLEFSAAMKKGMLPGVAGGTITAKFSRDHIDLTGELKLAKPLEGAVATVGYKRETGLTIAAENIPLPIERIPGVKDARASVKANRNPETGEWRVSGGGSGTFDLASVKGQIVVAIDGSGILITCDGEFSKGLASGRLNATITNLPRDPQGAPIPDQPPTDNFSVSGAGSASLKFGILTGTVGLALTPDQRVILAGEIAMPPSYPVFGVKDFTPQDPLLEITPPEFPIWGVSVAGYGIGIFAFVEACLRYDAYIGPGTLQNAKLGVVFDLEKPEDAVVDGKADFVVPAGAGFTFDIGGGLRARVAIASLEGRVGLDARLGIEAEARAGVCVHWTRAEGLTIGALIEAEAKPQLDVGLNASVTGEISLPWPLPDLSKTWGPWRKQLGSFGPELEVGVALPAKWSEREGLDFDISDLQITKRPELDVGGMMLDAFETLVG